MGRKNYVTAGNIKTKNAYMQKVVDSLDEIACYRRVVIGGDMGTGRDTVAELIHERSAQSSLPMRKVDCRQAKAYDLFIKPDVVTYLDDVHTLNKGMRRKLVLELRENADACVISSAREDLMDMAAKGDFPKDLFRTLAEVFIQVPRICQRREDIPAMVRDALSKYNKKYDKHVKIESSAMTHLVHYNYRSNISELYNIVERAVLINTTGTIKANSILSVLDADSLSLVTMICLLYTSPSPRD